LEWDEQAGMKEKMNFYRQVARVLLFGAVAFGLCSCAEIARDMGFVHDSDLQMRSGISGTETNPTPLDPFQTYSLVMAADECRFFTLKVPSGWYWKLFLTVANRDETRRGQLTAEIPQVDPAWAPLPASSFKTSFDLGREGSQAVLGIGNPGPSRTALFRLCQNGAPLRITIESQISATNALMGPDLQGKDFEIPGP
jgi:hypothetical protein